jgi:ATP-dependent DNA ligase
VRRTFQVPSSTGTRLGFRRMPAANIPFPPMEAELVRELPDGDGWQYEPKWDGFRGVLENAGGELHLWSRNERPLLRYFPELAPLGDLLPPKSALDGEIVIARDGALDFDAMQTRLHPAESRVRKLSAEIPAEYVVFDVLVWDGEAVWKLPLEERRTRVEGLATLGFRVSPATRELSEARGWLERFESLGLDGVVAKRLASAYLPGERGGMVKVKEHKSADCVVAGIRWRGDPSAVATLLLGLYRDDGGLDYVGSAAVAARSREDVARRVLPLLDESSDRRFSEPNRWGSGELEEAALRPELVVEVRYDKVQGSRFRHGTKLLRWREDKDPRDCTWRELRPPRDPNAPGVEALFGSGT